MSVSYKLRQYTSGFLLLLLAGFILASVSYITSIIPESTISNNNTSTNPYLVYSTSVNVNSSYVVVGFNPTFNYTPTYRRYLVFYTSGLNPQTSVSSITLVNGMAFNSPKIYRFNETVFYADTTSYGNIDSIRIYLNVTANGTLLLSFYDTNDINQALAWSPPPTLPAISNKLILSFISWLAGIVLVIQALHKFDIPI